MTTTAQARTLFPWFARNSVKVLLVTLVISSLIAAALAAIAAWRGWPEVGGAGSEPVDGEVVVSFSTTIFGIPLGAVAIAAFVVSIAQVGSFTRALIATGATRTALTLAHLANVLLIALAASAVAAAVLALEVAFAGGWIGSTFGLEDGDTFADGVPALLTGLGGALVALLAGGLIAAVFLRWPWWVGVGLLATVLWGVPLLAAWLAPVGAALAALAAWPGSLPLVVVVLVLAHWVVMRAMPVP